MPVQTLVTCTVPAVMDNPEPGKYVWCETERKDIPVGIEEMTSVCLLPKTVLQSTHQLVEMKDDKRKGVDHRCGVCWDPDSNNRPVTYTCWDCRCLMALCCGVSCLVTVITSRFSGIDLFIGGRYTHTWGSGLLGNPMTLCDVIRVYTKMNWNFNGGTNNVMIKYNDTVDSGRLQQCAVDKHISLAHASARDKPIRDKGRFGYMDTPVPDADWLYRCTVCFVPVRNIRIGYSRNAVDKDQSTDAAPVTESQVLYTILCLYKYCAAGYTLSLTFCNTVLKNLRDQELLLRCGDFPVYRTMKGAALVEDRGGDTFDVKLCVPWDAPEAVVDINSADVVTLGSLPDKVGLFGRREDAAASRILQGRDSRSVRFLVPDVCGVEQNFHDVTIVDVDEEREPKVTAGDLTHLCDSWPPGIFNHMKEAQHDRCRANTVER